MAKAQDVRPIIKLRSTAGTGYTYVTTKNKRTMQGKLEIKKYDPIARKHVIFVEKKICVRRMCESLFPMWTVM